MSEEKKKLTVVIGASAIPERYAYKAADRLKEHGHPFVLLSIKKGELFGQEFLDLKEKPVIEGVDTITLYIGAKHIGQWQEYLLGLNSRRIIFNPGTENDEFMKAAQSQGIETVVGCTLVMLGTGQF